MKHSAGYLKCHGAFFSPSALNWSHRLRQEEMSDLTYSGFRDPDMSPALLLLSTSLTSLLKSKIIEAIEKLLLLIEPKVRHWFLLSLTWMLTSGLVLHLWSGFWPKIKCTYMNPSYFLSTILPCLFAPQRLYLETRTTRMTSVIQNSPTRCYLWFHISRQALQC